MELGVITNGIFGFLTVLGNIAFVLALLAFCCANAVVRRVQGVVAQHAPLFVFVLSGLSLLGTLFYSVVIGYPACPLCMIARACMYPIVLIALGALVFPFRARMLLTLSLVLAALGALVSSYHWFKDMLLLYTGETLPCPAIEGMVSCDQIFVHEFGYVTIPMIALNAFLWIMLIAWLGIRYRKVNNP